MKTDLKRWLLVGLILLAIVLIVVGNIIQDEQSTDIAGAEGVPAESDVTRYTDATPETVPPMYQLGVWQGRVAVFDGTSGEPVQVTEMPASSLPDPDRLSLEAGLPVYTQEELAHLLEDYGS